VTNSTLTSDVIAQAALANLYENAVMLPLVYRKYEPEFIAGRGDTITVRVPTRFVSHEYNGTSITVQNATETGIPFTLNHHRDVSFAVTSKERALNIVDFSEQFLNPAMEALIQDIDRDILALRSDVIHTVGQAPLVQWENPRTLVDARTALTKSNVPMAGRVVVVGPDMSGEWLKTDLFAQAQQAGDTLALNEASLGARRFGFVPYETQNIFDNQGVAFVPEAFAVAFVDLPLPEGAAGKSRVNYKGISLRVVMSYDMNAKKDIISIDCLYGTTTLAPDRAVIIDGIPS